MSEWDMTAETMDGLDVSPPMAAPVVRTLRRSALRGASSRRQLHADASEQARHVRGRNAFVWNGRVLPLGLPLAAAAGLVTWQRRRSSRDAFAVLAGIGIASYLEARIEWSLRRRAYRRRRNEE